MTWSISNPEKPVMTTDRLARRRACWKLADPTQGGCCIASDCMAWQDVDTWLAPARDKKTGAEEMVDTRLLHEDLEYYEKLGEPEQAGFCGALRVRS